LSQHEAALPSASYVYNEEDWTIILEFPEAMNTELPGHSDAFQLWLGGIMASGEYDGSEWIDNTHLSLFYSGYAMPEPPNVQIRYVDTYMPLTTISGYTYGLFNLAVSPE